MFEMQSDELKTALANYIASLETSAVRTRRAEDRVRYEQHLASAAIMFATIEKQRSIDKIKDVVASERRSYGWDYLSGPEGKAAESAFDAFAKLGETAT